MEKERDVTVLIPTYYGNQLLLNCIGTLMQMSPGVKVLTYKNDIGWLKAANELMSQVTTDVILLNDDTLVTSDIVKAMSDLAYRIPSVGIVGGKSISMDKAKIYNYGIYVGPDGNTAHRHFGRPKDSVSVEKQQAVEGSCMYIKREVLQKVGMFDEIYGMGYREEVDLAFRAREAGYQVVSSPEAEYIHLVSQTNGPLGITNDTFEIFMSRWGTKLKQGKV
jgi:GT2 family glycosyltransferase